MLEKPLEVMAYEALHQPLSPLFLDYLSGHEGSRPFLGPGAVDLAAIAAAAGRAGALERPRAAVAEALARQQAARGRDGRPSGPAPSREKGRPRS